MFACVVTVMPAFNNISSATADSIRIKTVDAQAAAELQRQKDLIEWSERRAKDKDIDEKVGEIFPWILIGCFSTIILVIVSVTIVQYTKIRMYRTYAITKQNVGWDE